MVADEGDAYAVEEQLLNTAIRRCELERALDILNGPAVACLECMKLMKQE